MSKKKNVPKIVTQPLLLERVWEKSPRKEEPAGKVAATMKIEEHIRSDQPAKYPRAG